MYLLRLEQMYLLFLRLHPLSQSDDAAFRLHILTVCLLPRFSFKTGHCFWHDSRLSNLSDTRQNVTKLSLFVRGSILLWRWRRKVPPKHWYPSTRLYWFLWRLDPIPDHDLPLMSFTITLRHTTVVMIPLDEWSARHRDLYLTAHNTHNRQTSMPPAGFEPTIPASERPQTHALDLAGTGIGRMHYIPYLLAYFAHPNF